RRPLPRRNLRRRRQGPAAGAARRGRALVDRDGWALNSRTRSALFQRYHGLITPLLGGEFLRAALLECLLVPQADGQLALLHLVDALKPIALESPLHDDQVELLRATAAVDLHLRLLTASLAGFGRLHPGA